MPNRIYTSTGIFRAYRRKVLDSLELESDDKEIHLEILSKAIALGFRFKEVPAILTDRKSTRLNSSHRYISYAAFCLNKKKKSTTACSQVLRHHQTALSQTDSATQ